MGWFAVLIVLAAAVLCYGLILVLMPVLQRYALARPNARSSHVMPTPQGGGIAAVIATLGVAVVATMGFASGSISLSPTVTALYPILAGAVLLACVGAIDDLRPIGVLPRLLLQLLAVALVIETLPDQLRILSWLPVWLEHMLLIVAAIWFVNLVNFMDGLDWMTVAEIVPITISLALFGAAGQLPPAVTIVALALAGAMIGFAPFNKPIARLFLGDVGSLPIGLITGWMLLELAGRGYIAAALLLPLYYLTDATVTLSRRALNGEKVWDAHRSHFYQRATSNGMSVMQIVTHVLVLNVVLAIMAGASIVLNQRMADAALLSLGLAAVSMTLWRFSRNHSA